MNWEEIMPILNERTETTSFDKHYVYHIAWASRIIANIMPQKHIDISSLRWLPINLSNLKSLHADMTHLPFEDNSVISLSTLSVVEHIGLGRYGDPIDPNGEVKIK